MSDFFTIRTDLAMEANELRRSKTDEISAMSGVEAAERDEDGFHITVVKVLDENGSKELCKPIGSYITIDITRYMNKEADSFRQAAELTARELRKLLQISEKAPALVVGLGNPAITPDAVGPKTARHTLVTRHLIDALPEHFGHFRPISVIETGVTGTTGVESAEIVRAMCETVRPETVIAVDALASRRMSRVCTTVQMSDTGISPGSGVGNSRAEISENTLKVKTISLGVPTVVDAATLAADIMGSAGKPQDPHELEQYASGMMVTPRQIDAQVDEVSKLLGYAINLALHPGLTVDDVTMLLG